MKITVTAVVASSLLISGCATASNSDSDSPVEHPNAAEQTTEQVIEPEVPEEPIASEKSIAAEESKAEAALQVCNAIDQEAFEVLEVSGPYRPLHHRTESGEIESACSSSDESLLVTAVRHKDPSERATCVQEATWDNGLLLSPTSYPVEGGRILIDAESGTTYGGWEVGEHCFTVLFHSNPYLVVGNYVMGDTEAELSEAVLPIVGSSRVLVS